MTAAHLPPVLTARPYRYPADFHAVRDLLVATFPITGLGFNWEIRRWDGSHFHDADPVSCAAWRSQIQVWETAEGRIVGAAHTEGEAGYAHLQIHPDYRPELESAMIAWAEAELAAVEADGTRQLTFFVQDYDAPRQRLLRERGYTRQESGGVHRRLYPGERPLPAPTLAEGYILRTVGADDPQDGDRMAALLNAAFNRDFHRGADFLAFARNAPCFRRDLHLVAQTPDGVFAAHVGATYDEANRRGLFEPVCTHPAHRRHGLAQALMFEGLRRLKALGAVQVTVETGDAPAANALYESVGFTEAYTGHYWRRTL